MKKIIVTGISGFVGQHLAEHLISLGTFEIVGTSRSEVGGELLKEHRDKITIKKVDLSDGEAVSELIKSESPDYICHLAAMASASKSYGRAVDTLTSNIIPEINILEAIKAHSPTKTRILIVSSGEIYGMIKPEDLPVDEMTPLRPLSPYAVSKLTQDYLAYQYNLAYHLDVVRVRPYNHIGPGQKEGFVVSDFAKQIVEIEKGKSEAVIQVGNLEAKRDFTDVRDIVRAYALALEHGESGEVYNLGSDKSYKIADILTTLLSYSETKVTVKVDPEKFRPIDVPEIICNSQKFYHLTKWQPEISFETTLRNVLDYWRKII